MRQSPRLALAIVCLGAIAAPLDSAVNIAFPAITRAFGMGLEDIRWVIIAYVLTYASLMLVFGKAGDLVGYRRIFRIGLGLATVGFLACAAAPNLGLLLAGRMLQGVGIALTWSCAPALATSLYPESSRTQVLAIYGAVIALGSTIGPLAGGILVEHFGWPVVFWARAPLVLGALVMSFAIPGPATRPDSARRFDWSGAILLVTWLTAFLLAAARPAVSHPRLATGALLVVGIAALLAFVANERRHPEPIIRLQLFRDRRFTVLNLASIAVNLAGFAVMLLVPFHLARTAQLDVALAGLVLAINAAGIIGGSWLAGRLAPRVGQARLAGVGAGVSMAGLVGIGMWQPTTPPLDMAAVLLVQGLGLGLFQIAYADAVLAHLPRSDRGVAGSLTMVTRTIGVIGAATGLSGLHGFFQDQQLAAGAGVGEAFHHAFQTTFLCVAASVGIGLLVVGLASLRRPARQP